MISCHITRLTGSVQLKCKPDESTNTTAIDAHPLPEMDIKIVCPSPKPSTHRTFPKPSFPKLIGDRNYPHFNQMPQWSS